MFRFSFLTTFLVLFMAVAVLAAPAAVQADALANVTTPTIESRDETHTLEKRRTGKAGKDHLCSQHRLTNATIRYRQLGLTLDSETVVNTYAKGKFCGKTITIKNTKTGKTTTAKVMDSCPGCGTNDIDLSPAAFKKLGSLSTGVLSVSWNF